MNLYELPVLCPKYPPCLVCNGKGTGLHFGVNTCDACRGFFGRCITRKAVLKCKLHGKCPIDFHLRPCSSCRYQKCLALGMCRQGVRKGRDSSAHRTKVIEEVRRLELQAKMNKDGTLKSGNDYDIEMDRVVKLLTETRLQSLPATSQHLEDLLDKEKEYLEYKELENEMFGNRQILLQNEYQEFYEQTGLDIDGRKETAKKMFEIFQKSLDDLAHFAKVVPGFNRLPEKDQLKVISHSTGEVIAILYSHYINTDAKIMALPYDINRLTYIRDLLGYFDEPDYVVQQTINYQKRLQNLDLTLTESIMAAGLIFLIADVDICTSSRTILMNSADYLIEVLQREINKNHDPEEHTMAKLILVITDLRKFTPVVIEAKKCSLRDNIDQGFPQVLYDMFFNND